MEHKVSKALIVSPRHDAVEASEGRAKLAARVIVRVCTEQGMRVSSWSEFAAWNSYVAGSIDEAQLAEEVAKELESHCRSHGQIILLERQAPHPGNPDLEMERRAKRAGRIYRNVCRSSGLRMCFFNNFSAWSDFVSGRIGELDFLREVATEIGRMSSSDQPPSSGSSGS
jgi:hypothetical protein